MSIPKNLDFADFSRYPSDANPTTDSEMQVYFDNQNKLVKELAYMLWQPQTQYSAGQVIHSSAMPSGTQALVTIAGRSGNTEPTWSGMGTVVTDGGVTYMMINIVTQISVAGSGNAVTDVDNNNGIVTLRKDFTFPTTQTDISGKADKVNISGGTAGTSAETNGPTISVPYVTVNNQGIVTGYGTHVHTVSGFVDPNDTITNATNSTNSVNSEIAGGLQIAVCSTASETKNKVATCSGLILKPGIVIALQFVGGRYIYGGDTLNVNNTGAKTVVIYSSDYGGKSASRNWRAYFGVGSYEGNMKFAHYDGTNWCLNGMYYDPNVGGGGDA